LYKNVDIHAREWITSATAVWLLNEFTNNTAAHEELFKKIDIYIAPMVNPDGYEFAQTNDRMWRKTRRPNSGSLCIGYAALSVFIVTISIDIHIKFLFVIQYSVYTFSDVTPTVTSISNSVYMLQYKFHSKQRLRACKIIEIEMLKLSAGESTSANPCSDLFHGGSAFSQPETKALSDLIISLESQGVTFGAYMTFHSYGQYWLLPWGYTSGVYPPDYPENVSYYYIRMYTVNLVLQTALS